MAHLRPKIDNLGKSELDPSKSTQLFQTSDGGKSWAQVQTNSPLPLGSVIHFIDANMGYASMIGSTYDFMFDKRAIFGLPFFFFTLDGGRSWEQIELKLAP